MVVIWYAAAKKTGQKFFLLLLLGKDFLLGSAAKLVVICS